jgi:hypothetical protein
MGAEVGGVESVALSDVLGLDQDYHVGYSDSGWGERGGPIWFCRR